MCFIISAHVTDWLDRIIEVVSGLCGSLGQSGIPCNVPVNIKHHAFSVAIECHGSVFINKDTVMRVDWRDVIAGRPVKNKIFRIIVIRFSRNAATSPKRKCKPQNNSNYY